MHIKKEIREASEVDTLIAAQLAVAFTLLNQAPYDSWGHQGSPAEMATFIVAQAKKDGRLGFLQEAVLGMHWYREAM